MLPAKMTWSSTFSLITDAITQNDRLCLWKLDQFVYALHQTESSTHKIGSDGILCIDTPHSSVSPYHSRCHLAGKFHGKLWFDLGQQVRVSHTVEASLEPTESLWQPETGDKKTERFKLTEKLEGWQIIIIDQEWKWFGATEEYMYQYCKY